MALNGDTKQKKWVFWAANGTYLIGSFDGSVFKPETDALRSDFGNTSYAAQTYFDAPKNRRIQIAWFRGSEFPGMPWNQQMGFPVDLSLRATPDGPRLAFKPVKEIANLRSSRIKPSETGHYTTNLGLLDAAFTFKVPATGHLTLVVNGQTILFDAEKRVLRAGGKEANLLPSPSLELRVLADRASLEIFAQGGLVSMPLYVSPNSDRSGISLRYEGDWKVTSEEVYDLKRSWAH
jgi:sucrose-6-phosphate hydrolase SacC (GH32 family)